MGLAKAKSKPPKTSFSQIKRCKWRKTKIFILYYVADIEYKR